MSFSSFLALENYYNLSTSIKQLKQEENQTPTETKTKKGGLKITFDDETNETGEIHKNE